MNETERHIISEKKGTFIFNGRERLSSIGKLIPSGVLDLYIRSTYKEPGLITSYGHDIIVGFASYHLCKVLSESPKNKLLNASFGFLIPSAYEIAQAFGWWKGTFDWADFIAYGAGIGAALLTEKRSN